MRTHPSRPPRLRPRPAPHEQISYLDAILGNDNVNVEVVDGSVEIKVPQGCQPETVLRIRGKGAPQLNNASVSAILGAFVCDEPACFCFWLNGNRDMVWCDTGINMEGNFLRRYPSLPPPVVG